MAKKILGNGHELRKAVPFDPPRHYYIAFGLDRDGGWRRLASGRSFESTAEVALDEVKQTTTTVRPFCIRIAKYACEPGTLDFEEQSDGTVKTKGGKIKWTPNRGS